MGGNRLHSEEVHDATTRSVLPAPKDPAKLTDAEKLARYEHWNGVVGVSGFYEQKGTKWFPFASLGLSQTADNIARQANPTAPPAGPGQDIRGTAPGNPNRQPNIFIYLNGYYTIVRQDGNAPLPSRPVLPPAKVAGKLTDAEKLARYEHWQPVAINAGRYEVEGTILYQYDLVAKNQTADILARNKSGNVGTVNPNSELEFSNGNNTMVQFNKSADGKSVTRRTYTRLE